MTNDWMSCDGNGDQPSPWKTISRGPSRREVVIGMSVAGLSWALPRSALSQIALSPERRSDGHNVLVSLFLRGGADGLNIVAPYAEDAYHRMRPTLRLMPPGKGARTDQVLDLDGFFGLNPAFGDVLPMFRDGSLALIHAAGSGDQTRSHFEAMNTMERGLGGTSEGANSGWLARFLSNSPTDRNSPLRAVAFGGTMPDSLRGATGAIAVDDLRDFRLETSREEETRRILVDLCSQGRDAMSIAGQETLQVLDVLHRLQPENYRTANGASYPDSDLGRALRQVALLLRADVGLEVAVLDKGGWDTHVAQGVATGLLSAQLSDLGRSLRAFAQDLGADMKRVVVVVQTEFGRRLQENSGLGTDHGRGSFMMVLGGGVKGGKVYSRWPGLEEPQLEPPGDLRVTTDYREVLAEVLRHRLSIDPEAVLPGFQGSLQLF